MGKTSSEKPSASAPPSGTSDGTEASVLGAAPGALAAGEPAEPLERARLLAEVARQRVRIAKEELKRARKRVKEAKREAKRARKQAAVTRKAWKKARKAHRAHPGPQRAAAKRTRQAETIKGSARRTQRKAARRRAGGKPKSQADGNAPVT